MITQPEGILLVDKPSGRTSFSLVDIARKRTGQACIGHAGTLDPLATGLLVLLLGRRWTRQSQTFLEHTKEYEAVITLGQATDTYDREGVVTHTSELIPSNEDVYQQILFFQGTYLQTPPMFSAKKVKGRPLYSLARKGIVVERKAEPVQVVTSLLSYCYPEVSVHVRCSKGTYIRSIAHDLGLRLKCFAHITTLRRTRSGPFHVQEALPFEAFELLTPETVLKLLKENPMHAPLP